MRTVSLVYLLFLRYGPLNIENSHLSHIFMSTLFRERLMQLPLILTELWHLLDVSAVAGHGALLAALLLHDVIHHTDNMICIT